MENELEVESEVLKSAGFTIEILTRAGMAPEAAALLAAAGVDRWGAKELFERGCPWEMILEILA